MGADRHDASTADVRRRANLRLASVLAALVLAFFLGFILKSFIFGI